MWSHLQYVLLHYVLLHSGTEPVQFPEQLQTRISSPSSTKSGLQLYVAVAPSAVPLKETNSFLGSSSGPQLISREYNNNNLVLKHSNSRSVRICNRCTYDICCKVYEICYSTYSCTLVQNQSNFQNRHKHVYSPLLVPAQSLVYSCRLQQLPLLCS